MIGVLGRWYDRLAARVGQAVAGAIVLGLVCVVSLVLLWMLGES
jgi:hypothetical protein